MAILKGRSMQTLILGFDAFDPNLFERLSGEGRLPHLTRYADLGGYAPFAVASPPQSEVSWTSIATGLNPGGHGIFDFVHRDPATYGLTVSLLPTRRGVAGTQFVPPFRAKTLFDHAAQQGYPATSLWWPATFPARPESPVRTIPGLGTPDILGRLGVGTLFVAGDLPEDGERKIPVQTLDRVSGARYRGLLHGPARKKGDDIQVATLEVQLELTGDGHARLAVGKHYVELTAGAWSPFLELTFKVSWLTSVRAVTRAILIEVEPDPRVYFLPLQLHPLHSAWRYASPAGFVKGVWQACGPFPTLGWPQDTTALEEGCIDDEQFLALCASIMERRECALMDQLTGFREGVLAVVFDSLDRIQHMFWRDRLDVVESWYERLDGLLGRVEERLAGLGSDGARVVVVSDHGCAGFDYKVHLNQRLTERGYLVVRDNQGSGSLRAADWSGSRAYALGLNSLYVNLQGREGQGCVRQAEYETLVEELRQDLLTWQGPDGRPVVQTVERQGEAFEGPLASQGPDLVIGYSPGYRASAETGLGKWGATALVPNRDHWGADHCIAADAVPGVLFCSEGMGTLDRPSYHDFPTLTVGAEPDQRGAKPPSVPSAQMSREDEEAVEERLRGLGYL